MLELFFPSHPLEAVHSAAMRCHCISRSDLMWHLLLGRARAEAPMPRPSAIVCLELSLEVGRSVYGP